MSATLAQTRLADLMQRAEQLRGGAGKLQRLRAARAALGDHTSDAVAGLAGDLDARIGELGGSAGGDELDRIDAAIRALRP